MVNFDNAYDVFANQLTTVTVLYFNINRKNTQLIFVNKKKKEEEEEEEETHH